VRGGAQFTALLRRNSATRQGNPKNARRPGSPNDRASQIHHVSHSMLSLRHSILALSLGALLSFPLQSSADERRFSFVYETTTAAKGSIELENWVTWKHFVEPGKDLDVLQMRHEVEFGITDRLQLGLYLFDWSYDNFSRKAEHDASGIELIYNLTNPNTSFLGSAVYVEALLGEHELELEAKLLLQKNFGPVTLAWNLALEAEWEGERFGNYEERTGEFFQTLGVSYEVTKNFSFGAEALHEIEFPEWEEANDSVVWVGPNLSFRYGRAFATVAGLFQVTNNKEEPDVQTRLILGYRF
jgi:hypothetical protein